MEIIYANRRVEKYFLDFRNMQKKLPMDWVRAIKKHINHLEAAACFGDFLQLGLGRPEQLTGYNFLNDGLPSFHCVTCCIFIYHSH